MFDLKQKLLAVAVGCFLAVGVCAQGRGRGGDKRPPKPDNRVVVQPKGDKGEKPPQNDNQGNRGKGNKKGKP